MKTSFEERFVVYGGTSNHGFDASILSLVREKTGLDLDFSHIRFRDFPDGEPGGFLEDRLKISGSNVIVFSCPFDGEHREELHDIVTASKRQFGAKKVVAVLSFLPFRRQDRPEKTHETTRLRWFLEDLMHWGADYMVICEPHSVSNTISFCSNCGLKIEIADPTPVFTKAVAGFVDKYGKENVLVYSPDFGSVVRSANLAMGLGVRMLVTPKTRLDGDSVNVSQTAESKFKKRVKSMCPGGMVCIFDVEAVSGRHIIMREDEVQTGGTSQQTAWALRLRGAKSVRLLATHPVCTSGWQDKLVPHDGPKKPFDEIFFGNGRPRGRGVSAYAESTGGQVETVDLAPVFADALVNVINKILNPS